MARYNAGMGSRTAEYIDAINHLPAEGLLILDDISWEDYIQLSENLGPRHDLRASYDSGRLEILALSRQHAAYDHIIQWIVDTLADELDLELVSFGNATWNKEQDLKAIEGDGCYYIRNAGSMLGRDDDINLHVDPPPDLFVEIDVSHTSVRKFRIYASFGVPEIWRYDAKRKKALIYELREKSYVEVPSSPSFPILTGEVLADFMEQCKTLGRKPTRTALRKWIKKASAR